MNVKIKNKSIRLKKVTKSDSPFLYDLLRERDPRAFISHRKMPTYEEHLKFVMSKPYSIWYIILFNNQKIGSISLTRQDEIGLWITKTMCGKGIGTKVLQLFIKKNPRPRYFANISPRNLGSIEFFKKNGFQLFQYTYELINS